MSVQIDEAWRDDRAARIDHPRRFMRPDPPNPRNPAILDPDIAAKTRCAGAIDHHAVFNDDIEFCHGLPPSQLEPLDCHWAAIDVYVALALGEWGCPKN